jgi:hypothetical protein
MLEESALHSMRPMVMTPAYGGNVAASYALSLVGLTNAAWQAGLQLNIRVTNGSSLITRARNEMLVDFLLDSSLTHLVWIDADIRFDAKDLLRMLRLDLDVVAGAYPIKAYRWPVKLAPGSTTLDCEAFERMALDYPVNSDSNAGLARMPDPDGVLEVTEAPTGFMVIRRRVFDQMIARYSDLRYVPDGLWKPERAALCYRFFDVMMEPGTQRYLSEDYAFCRRWRAIGGKVHIDTRVALGHTGSYEFSGRLSDALSSRADAMGGA